MDALFNSAQMLHVNDTVPMVADCDPAYPDLTDSNLRVILISV